MSEPEEVELVAPGLPPEATTQESPTPEASPQSEPQAQADETEVELYEHEGQKLVPLGAVVSLRKEIQALKQQAAKVPQLEQTVNEMRPYVDFVSRHPAQPQSPQETASASPASDPALDTYAKRFDLYTSDGKPDVERARAIQDENRRIAREEASRLIEPVALQAYEQRAGLNVSQILSTTKDAEGRPLDQQYLGEAIAQLASGLAGDRAQVYQLLSDPSVAAVLADNALGRQARATRATPAPTPPQNPPLHVERAGGSQVLTLSDVERGRARRYGLTDEQALAGKKAFTLAQHLRLEE